MQHITIFVPLSREWRIDRMAEQLSILEAENAELLFVVDNSNITDDHIIDALKTYGNTKKILGIANTGNPPASEVNLGNRRDRITNVWELAKKLIPDSTDLIFTIEDDTEIKPDYLKMLLEDYNHLVESGDDVGLVSGIQVGRWGFKIIGAWLCDHPENPTIVQSMKYDPDEGFEDVDAAGFYCFITSRELFVNAEYRFNQWGPDVNFGFDLKAKGFNNYIDWQVITGHATNRGHILYPDDKCILVRYEKINDQWKLITPEKKNPSYPK